MSATVTIKDDTLTTLKVTDTLTAEDAVIEGDLLVLGTITPTVPGTVSLTGPLNTTWDPLTVTNLIATDTVTADDIVAETLSLDDPAIINNNLELNTTDIWSLTPLVSTVHSALHVQSDIDGASGTGLDDSTLKVSCQRSTSIDTDTIAADVTAVFNAAANIAPTRAFTATKSTVSNRPGTGTLDGFTKALYANIDHLSAGTIVDARAVHALVSNSGGGTMTSAVALDAAIENTIAGTLINSAVGARVAITNNSTGAMTAQEGISVAYNNLNTSVSNANSVVGLNVGGPTASWSAGTNAVIDSKGILIGSSCNVGNIHHAIYVSDAAGALRTSGRKKRYRVLATLASDVLTADDDIVYVDSSVTTALTLPALADVDETVLQVRNTGSTNVTLNTAGGGDLILGIGTGTAASSIVILGQTAGTFQATSTGNWIAVQLASSVTETGDRRNYRVLNTLATEAVVTSDAMLYIDSNIVSQVDLLALPTATLTGIDGNVLDIVNDGPNPVTVNADGVDLIKPLGGGASAGTVALGAYGRVVLQATVGIWRQVIG